jgi:hypothetical protein
MTSCTTMIGDLFSGAARHSVRTAFGYRMQGLCAMFASIAAGFDVAKGLSSERLPAGHLLPVWPAHEANFMRRNKS